MKEAFEAKDAKNNGLVRNNDFSEVLHTCINILFA